MNSVWQQVASLDLQRVFVFLVGFSAVQCLTAMWAATGARNWFWRALGVWIAFLLLLPIRAWEPAWMFMLAVPLIMTSIGGGTWLMRPRNPMNRPRTVWRFTVRDLLALVLIVSLWLPVVLEVTRAFHQRNWLGWFTCSAALALVALLAYLRAATQHWPMSRQGWLHVFAEFGIGLLLISTFQSSVTAFLVTYLLIAAVASGMTVVGWFYWRQTIAALLLLGLIPPLGQAVFSAGFWMRYEPAIRSSAFTIPAKIGMIDLFAWELAWALIGLLWLSKACESTARANRWRTKMGRVVGVVVGVWAISLCWTYARLLILPPATPVPKFTTPTNHYERIMAIAERAIVLSPNYESISSLRPTAPKAAEELEALCQELMPLLEAPNYVPYDPDQPGEYGWLCNHRHAVQMLPQILGGESSACRETQMPDSAAQYALAIIRLGDLQCRGALSWDLDTGTNVRRRGLQLLVALRGELSPGASRKVTAALQNSIDSREDAEVGWARRLWYHHVHWDGWALNLERVLFEKQERQAFANDTLLPERRQELAKRLLLAELAVRLFEHDRGQLPKSLSELVPDYLPAVPVDFHSQPLALRVDGDGFVVHCVGWDGLVDSGRGLNRALYSQPRVFEIDLDYLARQQF